MGQPGSLQSGAHFRRGKFGKALATAEATTNYIVNGQFANNVTDGWTFAQDGSGATFTRSLLANVQDGDLSVPVGLFCGRLLASSSGQSRAVGPTLAVANSASVTFSCWITGGAAGAVQIYNTGNSVILATINTALLPAGWNYVAGSWTNSTGSSQNVAMRVTNAAANGTSAHFFANAQLELKAYATPYCDGSLPGHTWSGTAHNSTSSRGANWLSYGTSKNINPNLGTVMGWVYLSSVTGNSHILDVQGTSAGQILVRINGANLQAYWGTSNYVGGTLTAGAWHHFAVTFANGVLRLYVNGADVGGGAMSGFSGMPATMTIAQSLNGRLDSFCIVERALPAKEVRAVFESDAPVFAESSVFSLRTTPRGLLGVDSDGLWMRDFAGDPVLGVYGGETVDYSWGGRLLNAGDILFGRYGSSNGAWAFFDRDGVASKPFFAFGWADKTTIAFDQAGARLDGELNISTSGGIFQGAGTFASPTNGIKLYNSGGKGRLATYDGGVVQVEIDGSGRITAGAGNVLLDKDGVIVNDTSDYTSTWMRFREDFTGTNLQAATLGSFQLPLGEVTTGWVDYPGVALTYTKPGGALVGMLGISTRRDRDAAGSPGVVSSWGYTGVRAVAVADWFSVVLPSGFASYSPRLAQGISAGLAQIVTDQSQLRLDAVTSVRSAANFEARKVLIVGGTNDSHGRIKPGGNVLIANGSAVALNAAFNGKIIIICTSEPSYAEFVVRSNGAPYEQFDPTGVYTNTSGTATSHNLYLSGGTSGNLTLQNNRGGDRTYSVIMIGATGDF